MKRAIWICSAIVCACGAARAESPAQPAEPKASTPAAQAAEAAPATTPPPTPSPTPALSQRERIAALGDDEIKRAIDSVRRTFMDPAATADPALQRATFEGLLLRLSPGVSLVPAKDDGSPKPHPFLAEILDSRIGYVRPGKLDGGTLAQFDAALASFLSKDVTALILDLRDTGGKADFDNVAEFARRLCPRGKLLFTLQKPSAKQERIFTATADPAFGGTIVVLTDPRTSGGAEALAGTLRENAGAMIIGTDTAGAAVEFERVPAGQGQVLEIAVSQILLPQAGSIFPGGVKPDIAASIPRATLERIFEESNEKGVSKFVFETERRHMNEAALVSGTNPEIDGPQIRRNPEDAPQLRDTVLQRAVDLVTAITFFRPGAQPRPPAKAESR